MDEWKIESRGEVAFLADAIARGQSFVLRIDLGSAPQELGRELIAAIGNLCEAHGRAYRAKGALKEMRFELIEDR